MGTIHQLPTDAESQVRLLEKLVSDMIAEHPDPVVAQRWQDMARATMARYPGPPLPSQPVLDLQQVQGLTVQQMQELQEITQQWLLRYFDDVRAQLMQVHHELLSLQKKVAEYEAQIHT